MPYVKVDFSKHPVAQTEEHICLQSLCIYESQVASHEGSGFGSG